MSILKGENKISLVCITIYLSIDMKFYINICANSCDILMIFSGYDNSNINYGCFKLLVKQT